ncbi:MAG TPA: hypothetical protein VGT61_06595 [Thermomicrobiales bacterium]|jgi:hypothetical protein|nr:hypothetical protein [Thermomicrobiales bacterium]
MTQDPAIGQGGPGSPVVFPSERRSLQVEVGLPTLRDLPDLYRLPGIELLNQPDSLLAPFSPFRTALRARLRWPRSRRRVLVARTPDRPVGYALFQPQRPDGRWRLEAIGAAIGIYDSVPVIEELLREGITLAGLNGVKRLYARVPHGAFAANGLRTVGFSPYATEYVFVADGISPRRMPRHVRSQQPADTWAIHQLYSAAVPRQVQYAEAFTSHRWDMPVAGSSVTVDGLVVEEGHHIVGMARIVSRSSGYCVELITLPERRELIHDLIDGVAAVLSGRPAGRIYATARGYHQEIASAFVDRGLIALHEQDLMIKYTTANVRLPVFEVAPAFVEVREGVPHRVPTFLQPRPQDDTVT